MLYPLKFTPIFKERVWGGYKLCSILNKSINLNGKVGESWELSALDGDESVVVNGHLAGNTIRELIEIYMDELVGQKVFNQYAFEFPLLFKFLDADDDLSIQVHPSNEIALEKYNCLGKTEMWYIVDAEPEAKIYLGFKHEIDATICSELVREANLEQALQEYEVKPGDAFLVPAGTVHAIGKGILLAEIQQSSDITYRLYDYNRKDAKGNLRELHVEEALQALSFDYNFSPVLKLKGEKLLENEIFNVNKISFSGKIIRNYSDLDSFVVLMCVEGAASLEWNTESIELKKGELVFLPAEIEQVELYSMNMVGILEVNI